MTNPIRSGFKFVNEGLDFIVILTNGTEKNSLLRSYDVNILSTQYRVCLLLSYRTSLWSKALATRSSCP